MCGTRSILLLVLPSAMVLIPGHLAAPQALEDLETDLSPEYRSDDQTSLTSEILTGDATKIKPNLERDLHNVTDEVMLQYLSNKLAKGVGNHSRSKRFGHFDQGNFGNIELMMFFARVGNLFNVKMFIESAILPVDAQDDKNWTALMWSSRMGHTPIVHYLLEADADVDHQNNKGDTALLWATGAGNTDIVELLLLHEADPNLWENVNLLTPVSVAAAMNREPELRLMDKLAWIDLDHQDKDGRTPLNLASMTGQATMALLLGYHGNVDIADNNGMGPAHWGVNLRSTQVLQAILLLCPNLDLEDGRGNTPWMIADKVGNHKGKQLIEDHLSTPNRGCSLGDDELPSREFIFFDCKQMQCMCGGFWKQTGVRDPECIRPQVNVLAQQQVESSNRGTEAPYVGTTKEDDHHNHNRLDNIFDIFKPYEEDDHDDDHDDDH